MPLVGFEPTISAGERPQTYALDRETIGTGINQKIKIWIPTAKKTSNLKIHLIHKPSAYLTTMMSLSSGKA